MSALLHNAVDSLRVGMHFFLDGTSPSAHKHAILSVFHSIELFLKEQLFRVHPILIYKNIDKKISDDTLTVGIAEVLGRLDNLNLPIPESQRRVIEGIQRRRNRIEHHRYDRAEDDRAVLAESLKFIMFFVERILGESLDQHLDPELLKEVTLIVLDFEERGGLAQSRLEKWLRGQYPEWDPKLEDSPEDFVGTLECPECDQDFLVLIPGTLRHCFFCNAKINAVQCPRCGEVHRRSELCWCGYYGPHDSDERDDA